MANRKIKILPGGPYEVPKDVPLAQAVIETDSEGTSEKWAQGKVYPQQAEPYHLCRCGHSQNKPYCDGTHKKIGFEGTEYAGHPAYKDGVKVYSGGKLELLDNESLCASMRFCDRGKGVWQAAVDSADPASEALAIEESCACASGRLTAVRKDGTAAGRRGPLWVKGGIELEGADGQSYEVRNRMTLCRCGESKNMPYCDISHMNCPHMEGFDK